MRVMMDEAGMKEAGMKVASRVFSDKETGSVSSPQPPSV